MSFRKFLFTVLVLVATGGLLGACGSNPQDTSQPVEEVGFDLDDTLVFSTPAFRHAFNKDVEPFSEDFWSVVNRSDSEYSCIKHRTVELLRKHRRKGRKIYVITAREPHNAEVARDFVHSQFDIPRENVYFEPDGKADRLRQLGIDIYYGDSDSDISDSRKAGIKAVRIRRNPKSSYDKKYNPGKYDEKVLKNTTGHRCS